MKMSKSHMLNKGRKGFTLTELAIVIAVIAILIAVLVPTFTSIITKARNTTASEEAKNAVTEYTIEQSKNAANGSVVYLKNSNGEYYFVVEDSAVILYTEYDGDDEDCKAAVALLKAGTTYSTLESNGFTLYPWETEEYQDGYISLYLLNDTTTATYSDTVITAVMNAYNGLLTAGSYIAFENDGTTTYYYIIAQTGGTGYSVSSSTTSVASIDNIDSFTATRVSGYDNVTIYVPVS